MKESWTSLASLLGTLAFCQTLLQSVLPPELRFACFRFLKHALGCYYSYCYFEITNTDGLNTNNLYDAVQLYLSSFASTSCSRLSLSRVCNSSSTTFVLSNNDCIADVFGGVSVQWKHVVAQSQSQDSPWGEKRSFTLWIRNATGTVSSTPTWTTMDKANDIRRKNRERLLYTNSHGGWRQVPFKHPSTFDTLAVDPERKRDIMEDLRDFMAGKAFYQRTGRAWKRGYLLYGPPGTGKSSMIAAMANFLGYDIYDLELTKVHSNSDLRELLTTTSSKSIIVIEDIDCSVKLSKRLKAEQATPRSAAHDSKDGNNNTITLSGLLNFTDGLWSCCGSERIFVFTSNQIEKLDPALLRSGRMDMHIYMSYCSYPALKILLRNYLEYEDKDLGKAAVSSLQETIERAKMTPADISEVLIKNRRNKEKAVSELLMVLKARAERNEKYGGMREGCELNGVEDEEQEKCALDGSEEGSHDDDDSCY
ncbi:LOW QUALITY PROTEIN: hypothetical protein BT93_C1481 [Corymbia citriodora subsp. variegata]|nr:LOW QUALITY PROTEIN: hypothetical protein BT93_C1481 [Corymbia citriodora subsp. variegata]